jgi:hypothetical protein
MLFDEWFRAIFEIQERKKKIFLKVLTQSLPKLKK